jgi:uncharacterized membrane protein (UPF0127 family)
MLNNQMRREILDMARATGFEGSILDLYQMANQGANVPEMLQAEAQAKQENMLVAQTPQEQQVGLREQQAMGNTDASMVFPNVPANTSFNTEGMKVPINISKVDEQGHLVQSYQNVPPGIKDLPTGPKRGTVIETPAYKKGGYRSKHGKDPVTGTGKKPKGSGRRLYTDENPKDTVGIRFATPADARATVAKVKRSNKPFARKIQILTVGEQRAKVMGKTQVASIFTKGKEAIRRSRKKA